MKIRFAAALVAAAAFLSGCAVTPQQPIAFAPAKLKEAPARQVGVVMTKLPKVDTAFPGAGCLLCYAAAATANGSLTRHTASLTHEDLPQLKTMVVDQLTRDGVAAKAIDEELDVAKLPKAKVKGPNLAKRDFTQLKEKYGVDQLLVIELQTIGFVRNYSAYVPLSDPKATFAGSGYMVDLNDNSLQWYREVLIQKAADGAWDEPPAFPGLTNAYYQALELGKDDILTALKGQ
ncbi:MAG: hypothetical protein K0S46_2496 [Moraxellaceae bacterium]|nr:hypothetical protein [Moraxellaceae bacterium]